jgi:hypothetical protein
MLLNPYMAKPQIDQFNIMAFKIPVGLSSFIKAVILFMKKFLSIIFSI